MNYPAQIFVAETDARKSRRRPVNFAGRMREAGAVSRKVTITDISYRGCRLQAVEEISPGSTIWLKLGRLHPVRAKIAWVKGVEAGCLFQGRLVKSELAAFIAEQQGGAIAPPPLRLAPPPSSRRSERGVRTGA
jgi:hypothetical protein